MAGQPGFFDVDERYAALSAAGDPLERLKGVVGFELFRVLVLQALYSLSDEQAEFQLRDRLSCMRLVGLGLHEPVPDPKTIWLPREQLKQAGAMEGLFRRFDEVLAGQGLLAMGGQSIDATIIAAPRQKLTLDEKATIRSGGTPAVVSDQAGAEGPGCALDAQARQGQAKVDGGTQRRAAIQIAVRCLATRSTSPSTGATA